MGKGLLCLIFPSGWHNKRNSSIIFAKAGNPPGIDCYLFHAVSTRQVQLKLYQCSRTGAKGSNTTPDVLYSNAHTAELMYRRPSSKLYWQQFNQWSRQHISFHGHIYPVQIMVMSSNTVWCIDMWTAAGHNKYWGWHALERSFDTFHIGSANSLSETLILEPLSLSLNIWRNEKNWPSDIQMYLTFSFQMSACLADWLSQCGCGNITSSLT